ncbi:hypothetical protein CVU82_00960 [Candidatus Falkowbacteria bacterium HGW-Falkowbacteria-1]|uniref:Type 4 fimbrial biogenesis protein PilX N-terminal domain-containing protein n=1 Tax=Candidatus Falkowbacteria bacterium HGW-Falkowbacteria-1 TaxID=2013768 RepID=A0A2N2EAL4_9BACT|nr:MAG: hypothetical protein CVU82_00960 [Candidatus Falkowbacteria bacterium HGW-Falkowbacteria-1]
MIKIFQVPPTYLNKNILNFKRSAFVAMISVLIVSVVVLSISVTIVFVNINAIKNSLSIRNSDQARMLAESCSEYALEEIVLDSDFSGGDSVVFDDGECSYNVIVGAGEERTIELLGQVKNSTRREKIEIDSLNPDINIVSWQEVASF